MPGERLLPSSKILAAIPANRRFTEAILLARLERLLNTAGCDCAATACFIPRPRRDRLQLLPASVLQSAADREGGVTGLHIAQPQLVRETRQYVSKLRLVVAQPSIHSVQLSRAGTSEPAGYKDVEYATMGKCTDTRMPPTINILTGLHRYRDAVRQ